MTPTLTQSLGFQTKQYLNDAYQRQDAYDTHLVGRLRLLGTVIVGTVEIITRLVFFLLGHIAGVFCLYQSEEINRFLNEQTQGGFSASVITSASFFSLLAPNLFRNISFPQEFNQGRVQNQARTEPHPLNQYQERIIETEPLNQEPPPQYRPIADSGLDRRLTDLIVDIVRLPFEGLAFCFKLPFYCIYLTFQFTFVLPIRLMLLPFQVFVDAFSFERPRQNFDLNLI